MKTKTATAISAPVLIERTNGVHMGQGNGDGNWQEEEHWEEWYDNTDGTMTKKIVVMISKHTAKEDNIHTHKTIAEAITKEEYFKRKLAGTS